MNTTDPIPIRGASAPDAEGVYLIADQTGEIVYIGRSGSLRKRIQGHAAGDVLNSAVAQHIYDGQTFHADYPRMSAWVRDKLEEYTVAWIVTSESHTVERHRAYGPRLNRMRARSLAVYIVVAATACTSTSGDAALPLDALAGGISRVHEWVSVLSFSASDGDGCLCLVAAGQFAQRT